MGDTLQNIYLLPLQYSLSEDGATFYLPRRSQSIAPEAVNNTSTLICGSTCEYAVWGKFSGELRLLSAENYVVSCLNEQEQIPEFIDIFRNETSDSNGNMGFKSRASLVVSANAEAGKNSGKNLSLRVVSTENPDICAEALINVVRPEKLYVVSNDYVIRYDRICLGYHHKNEDTEDAGWDLEHLPDTYVLSAGSEELNLRCIALCNDGKLRYLDSSEVKYSLSSECLNGHRLRFWANTDCEAKSHASEMVEAEFSCAVASAEPYHLHICVLYPQALAAFICEENAAYCISENGRDLCCHVRGGSTELLNDSAERCFNIGVGQELQLNVFARYSDGQWRNVRSSDCQMECFCTDELGEERISNALILQGNGIVAVSSSDKRMRLSISLPGYHAEQMDSDISCSIYTDIVSPQKLYVVPAHYGFSLVGRRHTITASELEGLSAHRTVGIGDRCAIGLRAVYEDGTVRTVSGNYVDFPELQGNLKRYRRGRANGDNGAEYKCVDIRLRREIVIAGVALTKEPLRYKTRISGTDVECEFTVAVCKVKALHLVRGSMMRIFNDRGLPLHLGNGTVISDDTRYVLDDQILDLRVGKYLIFGVLAEYDDGCWGRCNYSNLTIKNTAGIEVCHRYDSLLVRPCKQTLAPPHIKVVLNSNSKVSVSLKFAVILPDCLRMLVSDSLNDNDSGKMRCYEIEDNELTMKIGEERRFLVMAVYGDDYERLPAGMGNYNVGIMGAGVRVSSGRNDSWSLEESRLEMAESMQSEEGENAGNIQEREDVYLIATKRTRSHKPVAITVRLGLKPSVKGELRVTVV